MPIRVPYILLCVLAASPFACCANIYGYVDEQGVTYLSNAPLDSRYSLLLKEPGAVAESASHAANTEPKSDTATAMNRIAQLRKQYASLVSRIAREQNMDAALLHAVITVESGYNARAKSPKGASGLMQLMPGTAVRYGVTDIWDPVENVRAGAQHLRELLVQFNGDIRLALAAYNAGAAAMVGSGNKVPPYAETRSYVPRVLQYFERFRTGATL
jgi:soluble lytic murein transglycosylase-like protein